MICNTRWVCNTRVVIVAEGINIECFIYKHYMHVQKFENADTVVIDRDEYEGACHATWRSPRLARLWGAATAPIKSCCLVLFVPRQIVEFNGRRLLLGVSRYVGTKKIAIYKSMLFKMIYIVLLWLNLVAKFHICVNIDVRMHSPLGCSVPIDYSGRVEVQAPAGFQL